MARQTVNIGSAPNDGTGDPLRVAYDKLNDNFLEIYDDGGANIIVNNPVTLTETTLDVALADIEAGGGGGAVTSVNSDTGAVIVDLESVLNEGNETTNYVKFVIDADNYILVNTASQTIDFYSNAFGSYASTLLTRLESGGALFKNLTDPTTTAVSISQGQLSIRDASGGNYVVFTQDKLAVYDDTNTLLGEYDYPTGASSQIATLLDIPSPITIDATPTDGSSNAVSSNGVFDALATKVSKSDYTPAHSILVQQSGTGTPTALSVGNNTLVGRLSGGGSDINDLSVSDVRTLLSIDTDLALKENKPLVDIRTTSSALTGTTAETQITSFNFQFPANTFADNDIMFFENFKYAKTGTLGSLAGRIRLSNTNNFATATQVARFQFTAGNVYYRATRKFSFKGANLVGFNFNEPSVMNDITITSLAEGSMALDRTQIIYGFISLTLGNSGDSAVVNELQIYKR